MHVLRDAHAPADDGAAGGDVDLGRRLHLRAAQAGLGLQQAPVLGTQVLGQGLEAGRVFGDEGMVQHAAAPVPQCIVLRDHMLHDALDGRDVAAHAQLKVVRADGRGAQGGHLQLALRVLEALQPALAQRVEAQDARAAFVGCAQLAQHARVVGAGVLAEDEDGIGLLEIGQLHRALAHADLRLHAAAAGLVAHVGAVGKLFVP